MLFSILCPIHPIVYGLPRIAISSACCLLCTNGFLCHVHNSSVSLTYVNCQRNPAPQWFIPVQFSLMERGGDEGARVAHPKRPRFVRHFLCVLWWQMLSKSTSVTQGSDL